MKILIDNGHGVNTKGKCSPDRRLLEYKWNREVAVMLELALKKKGIDAERIVTEEHDISLSERARRVNAVCASCGKDNVALISIHVNAAPPCDNQWHQARGFSVWIAPKASSKSKLLAQEIYDCAARRNLKGNRAIPPEKYFTANFTILTRTTCAAVLTENLFQDNLKDVEFLLSAEGKATIVDLHVEAITKFISKCAI